MIKKRFLLVLIGVFSLIFNSTAQTVIPMKFDSGIYELPCEINGLKLNFIFDTGASTISLSSGVASMMMDNGYLDKEDIKGSGKSQIANGNVVDHTVVNIKNVKIGDITLKDVEAVIIYDQSAPLLLGQSAIRKLGEYSIIDNNLIIKNENTVSNFFTKVKEKASNYKLYIILSINTLIFLLTLYSIFNKLKKDKYNKYSNIAIFLIFLITLGVFGYAEYDRTNQLAIKQETKITTK